MVNLRKTLGLSLVKGVHLDIIPVPPRPCLPVPRAAQAPFSPHQARQDVMNVKWALHRTRLEHQLARTVLQERSPMEKVSCTVPAVRLDACKRRMDRPCVTHVNLVHIRIPLARLVVWIVRLEPIQPCLVPLVVYYAKVARRNLSLGNRLVITVTTANLKKTREQKRVWIVCVAVTPTRLRPCSRVQTVLLAVFRLTMDPQYAKTVLLVYTKIPPEPQHVQNVLKGLILPLLQLYVHFANRVKPNLSLDNQLVTTVNMGHLKNIQVQKHVRNAGWEAIQAQPPRCLPVPPVPLGVFKL